MTLEQLKIYRIKQIEKHSDDLIAQGMQLTGRPEGTVIVPMDLQHRQDFELMNNRSGQIPSWPLYFLDYTRSKFIVFVDADDLSDVCDTGFLWGMQIQGDGGTLMAQIMACTTIQQVNAIKDERTWEDYNGE